MHLNSRKRLIYAVADRLSKHYSEVYNMGCREFYGWVEFYWPDKEAALSDEQKAILERLKADD